MPAPKLDKATEKNIDHVEKKLAEAKKKLDAIEKTQQEVMKKLGKKK